MLPLAELQTLFYKALVAYDAKAREALPAHLESSDLPHGDQIDIYANNMTASLIDVLKETFPAVCRLVDESFFSYAACEFIAAYPPKRPCLSEYGAEFSKFLAEFPPTRELVYLPDVARFEWLMNVAAHAADFSPIDSAVLADIAPEDGPRLCFGFAPSIAYLESRYPIDAVWRANRSATASEVVPDLDSGGVFLEIRRHENDVVFRRLEQDRFEFRRALALGSPLIAAIERAFAANADFVPSEELAALFAERSIAAISLGSIPEQAP